MKIIIVELVNSGKYYFFMFKKLKLNNDISILTVKISQEIVKQKI